MEIVKFNSMSTKYEPLNVLTALGNPIFKLNPKVLGLIHSAGAEISSFFADGDVASGGLDFTKRGAENANAIFTGDAITFPSTAFGCVKVIPQNKPTTIIMDFETLVFGASRVMSIGTSITNMFLVAHTSATSLSITINHSNSINIPVNKPLGTRIKLAIASRDGSADIILDGQVVGNLPSTLPSFVNNLFILNGASNASAPSNQHKIYGLEIYSGINHTNADVIKYMQSM